MESEVEVVLQQPCSVSEWNRPYQRLRKLMVPHGCDDCHALVPTAPADDLTKETVEPGEGCSRLLGTLMVEAVDAMERTEQFSRGI